MSTILFTVTPISGRVRPALPIARELAAAGHRVLWCASPEFAGAASFEAEVVAHAPEVVVADADSPASVLAARAHGAATVVVTASSPGLPRAVGRFLRHGARRGTDGVVADRFLVASIPELDDPRSDLPPHAEHIGAVAPAGEGPSRRPAWWADVASARAVGRPVVLVAPDDGAPGAASLVRSAVQALADDDVLVLAAAAGLPAERPANLRVAAELPLEEVVADLDVLVTTGGLGAAQLALSHGVPVVVAGRGPDAADVGAQVARAGVGVWLRAGRPTPAQVATAVHGVLAGLGIRRRAEAMPAAFARYGGARRAAEVIAALAAERAAGEATRDRIGADRGFGGAGAL
ncbi:glycosyltransferase [Pengzhenrongella sicca]|uniref:Erythromycin biosynthesis protein CIII-like C-terminal domain-containing protein n=1 Tax=Pengzhenrongella sicca TaxID=2819238 RepID=A0A8A4ZF10_9MICO|nr:nucleotide disphospho-sugar-binding domain-containing protein [Pengzhenrongella sicca]QTE30474.1 hypothetical protein J4E96_05700 [Pengzhenrongella sicca]